MATVAETFQGILRALLQPAVVGAILLGMVVVRELYPRWSPGLRVLIYDLVLIGLVMLMFMLAILRVMGRLPV